MTLAFNHTTNVTGPGDFFFRVPNQLTGGAWGLLIVSFVFTVSFISMQRFGIQRSGTASGFITFLTSVLLVPFGVVGGEVVVGTAVITLLGMMIGSNGGR